MLMVRLMGCTQVEIITGPIRAKAFRIPSERKEKSGRYRKSSGAARAPGPPPGAASPGDRPPPARTRQTAHPEKK